MKSGRSNLLHKINNSQESKNFIVCLPWARLLKANCFHKASQLILIATLWSTIIISPFRKKETKVYIAFKITAFSVVEAMIEPQSVHPKKPSRDPQCHCIFLCWMFYNSFFKDNNKKRKEIRKEKKEEGREGGRKIYYLILVS